MNLTAIQGNIVSMRGNLLAMDARKPFIIEVDTRKGNEFNTFTLPLTNHTTDIYVKTSDGQSFTISNYLDPKRIINFASAGVYTIELRGQCGWSFNNTGDCQKIVSISSFGTFKFNYLYAGFHGCINMTSIPIDASIYAPNIVTIGSLFRECTNLKCAIPPTIFRLCINVTEANSCFNGAGFTGAVPSTLLCYMTKLKFIAAFFQGCTGLTGSIPDDVLWCLPDLENISYIFYNTRFSGSIPALLLRYASKLKYADSIFHFANQLTGTIPLEFLKYCPLLISIKNMFVASVNLSGIFPSDFFFYSPNLTDISGLLNGCRNFNISSFFMPTNIIPNITSFNNMMYTAYTVGKFTGTIQDIWTYASPTATKVDAFKGQTDFTNYNYIPNEWKGL